MSGSTFDMIYCGVGGQGVVLMANIVGEACAAEGLNVLSGELHGLSQRSGSVIAHQRIGEDAVSPLVPYGEADAVIALEPMEALRYLCYLKPGGYVITSTNVVHPPIETQMVAKGERKRYITYQEITEAIRTSRAVLLEIDSLSLAGKAGNPQTENVVLVGTLSAVPGFPVGTEALLKAVKDSVPSQALDANVNAFELGRKAFLG